MHSDLVQQRFQSSLFQEGTEDFSIPSLAKLWIQNLEVHGGNEKVDRQKNNQPWNDIRRAWSDGSLFVYHIV